MRESGLIGQLGDGGRGRVTDMMTGRDGIKGDVQSRKREALQFLTVLENVAMTFARTGLRSGEREEGRGRGNKRGDGQCEWRKKKTSGHYRDL